MSLKARSCLLTILGINIHLQYVLCEQNKTFVFENYMNDYFSLTF